MGNLTRRSDAWARNTVQAVPRWQAGVQRAAQRRAYCEGIARFLGLPATVCAREEVRNKSPVARSH